MSRRSAKAARLFGLIMILMVSAWDMDAMRPHIAAHSWYTLAFVALFLIVHVSDYLTVGQLVTRIDPLALADPDRKAATAHNGNPENELIRMPGLLADKPATRYGWRSFFPRHRPEPSLNLGQPTAKLYTFTAVTTTAAQASGAPYPITQQHYVVKPE
jgi:hypothetical protein